MSKQLTGSPMARISLGARLRRLREARGITMTQAAAAISGSDSKISRIERGRHAAREIDVADLLDLYQVTDQAERDTVLDLASQALAPPWWQPEADLLPTWFQSYLGLEDVAESLDSYDTYAVPGLLQTAEYTAGLLGAGDFGDSAADRLLRLHAERISRYQARGGLLRVIIEDTALLRPVTGRRQHLAQLRHLRVAAGQPGVRLMIRPLAAGAAGVPAGFTIVRMNNPYLADLVYTEQLAGANYFEKPAEVSRYAAAFRRLESTSHPADDTPVILDQIIADLENAAS